MDRITIDIAKEELDFIREALAQKYRSLISYLDTCEGESQKQGVTIKIPDDVRINQVFVKNAPWGLKKDGTPKKRPGRKVEA